MVRPRRADDAAALEAALLPVHERDAYPIRRVHANAAWLYDGLDVAWVAELDGRLLGHVAVAPDADPTGPWHLTRFFVALDARGTGAGTALLDEVDHWADARGLDLVLDVVDVNADARAMYERRGWERTGEVEATWVSETGPWPRAFTYRRPHVAP